MNNICRLFKNKEYKTADEILNTKIVKVDPNNIDYQIIKDAADIIKNGGLVVFPTETVYGIGADAYNETACEKIFNAKGRPQDNPLIVHISDYNRLKLLAEFIPERAKILADNYWPGPLTMIFNKNKTLPNIITAGLKTVAIRIPANNIALALIRESKTPIAAPSANISGKPSPTQASHVIDDLLGKVDLIIDGGSTEIGVESTVVDMTLDIPMILRPGNVTLENIIELLGECDYDQAVMENNKNLIPKSPGQKYKHYSPKAQIILYIGDIENMKEKISQDYDTLTKNGKKVGIMSTVQTREFYGNKRNICLGDRTNLITISSNLFKEMRNYDKMGVDIILSEAVEYKNIGRAIMNRLTKASSKTVIV